MVAIRHICKSQNGMAKHGKTRSASKAAGGDRVASRGNNGAYHSVTASYESNETQRGIKASARKHNASNKPEQSWRSNVISCCSDAIMASSSILSISNNQYRKSGVTVINVSGVSSAAGVMATGGIWHGWYVMTKAMAASGVIEIGIM